MNLILDLFVKFTDAANLASGLTVQLASDATGMNRDETLSCMVAIAALTGDAIVSVDGEFTLLYQNYEPRSIGCAAQGIGRLIAKRRAPKVIQVTKGSHATA